MGKKKMKRSSKNTVVSSGQSFIAALSYLLLFITGFIVFVLERKSSYVRFHALQSVFTFGGLFALYVFLQGMPFGQLFGRLLALVMLFLWMYLMFKAVKGERYKVPFFGELAEEYSRKR